MVCISNIVSLESFYTIVTVCDCEYIIVNNNWILKVANHDCFHNVYSLNVIGDTAVSIANI